MAVTVANVINEPVLKTFTVIATADPDAAAVIPHLFGGVAPRVWLVPLLPNFYVSQWTLGVVDGTNINLVKGTAVGSGNAAPQVLVFAQRPTTLYVN